MLPKGFKFSEESKKKMSKSQKGRVHSEETRKKMSESQKGKIRSEETKRNMSKAQSGKNNPNYGKHRSEETKQKIRESKLGDKNPNYGKSPSEETRRKISKAFSGPNHPLWKGGVFKNNVALYETFAHRLQPVEEIFRVRFQELGKPDFKVRCYKCKEWFYPTRSQVCSRVDSINKRSSGGEGHFYCSDECKSECQIYKRRKFPESFKKSLNRPYVDPDWREMVLARADYKCEKCGSTENLIAHHIQSATLNPMLANDVENGMCVCYDCHEIIHKEDGCRRVDLRC